jgi:mycothiol synthase
VDPSEQGTGLGKALTIVGLRHLRQLGLPDAMLYVDGDNEAAIRLYTGLGFTRWETDVMFSKSAT